MLRRADTRHDNLPSDVRSAPPAEKKTETISPASLLSHAAQDPPFSFLTPHIRRRQGRRTIFSHAPPCFRPLPGIKGKPPHPTIVRRPALPPVPRSPARRPLLNLRPGSRVRAMPCPFRRPSHCPGSTRTSPRLGSAPLPTSSPRQPFLRPSFSAPPADKKSAAPASENSDQERRSLLTVTLR